MEKSYIFHFVQGLCIAHHFRSNISHCACSIHIQPTLDCNISKDDIDPSDEAVDRCPAPPAQKRCEYFGAAKGTAKAHNGDFKARIVIVLYKLGMNGQPDLDVGRASSLVVDVPSEQEVTLPECGDFRDLEIVTYQVDCQIEYYVPIAPTPVNPSPQQNKQYSESFSTIFHIKGLTTQDDTGPGQFPGGPR